MRIQALTRHAGVSSDGGPGLLHFRAANVDSRVLRSAWDDVVLTTGLGGPLRVRTLDGAVLEGCGAINPFVPLDMLRLALEARCAGRALSPTLASDLAIHASDARMYDASYGLHLKAARRRGWVVQPLRLGFMPAILLGAGRHARLLIMNMMPTVSAPLALVGSNKAAARDLLAAHGLPVAPGSLAGSAEAALRVARQLGGPVVIKRLVGGNSDGVIVGVSASRDITSAAKLLLAGGHAVLVESLVVGIELRLHFVAGRLHRAFRAQAFTVTGDGRGTLAELIGGRYPRYLHVMSASAPHQRRLVLCLWALGVRKFSDVHRVVPASGRVVRVSAASGSDMEPVSVTDFVPVRDVARIERFLAHHGAPSCGLDMVIHTAGAPLDEGGVILEVNVPCGFAYLDDPHRAVVAELDAAIAGDATFRRDKGRIPVWLLMEPDVRRLTRRAVAALKQRHGRVAVGRLDVARSSWIALLNQSDTDALLVIVSEEAIVAHGIPVNLAPVLLHDGGRRAFEENFPMTCRTVVNAKGRLGTVPAAR